MPRRRVIARVVAALSSPERPVGLDRARIERQMRNLALDHVAERIDDSGYLERLGQLRVDLATVDVTPRGDLPAKRAVEWLQVLADTWSRPTFPRPGRTCYTPSMTGSSSWAGRSSRHA
jgi:hypothetical protein